MLCQPFSINICFEVMRFPFIRTRLHQLMVNTNELMVLNRQRLLMNLGCTLQAKYRYYKSQLNAVPLLIEHLNDHNLTTEFLTTALFLQSRQVLHRLYHTHAISLSFLEG